MQHSKWDLMRAEERETIISLDLLATPSANEAQDNNIIELYMHNGVTSLLKFIPD